MNKLGYSLKFLYFSENQKKLFFIEILELDSAWTESAKPCTQATLKILNLIDFEGQKPTLLKLKVRLFFFGQSAFIYYKNANVVLVYIF